MFGTRRGGSSGGGRRVERRVLGEDRGLQPAQLGSRVEPELLAEDVTTFLEDPQGIGLPAGAIQRNHQERTRTLTERVRRDERFELADHTSVSPELKLHVELLLDGGEAQFRHPADFRRREVVIGELGERIPSPQRIGLGQEFDGAFRVAACRRRTSVRNELLESVHINGLRR